MLRIPILYGGAFDEQDRRDTPRVAVINETMARQYFGGVNAVGRRFRFEADTDGWIEVVGVVKGHRDGRPARRSRRSDTAIVEIDAEDRFEATDN